MTKLAPSSATAIAESYVLRTDESLAIVAGRSRGRAGEKRMVFRR
jgi:hypothetical protein